MKPLDISIVVPLYNEEESLPELVTWIDRVMRANNFSYEVLLMDDGSSDGSWPCIERLAAENSAIKGIRLRRNYGKSAALNVGFEQAQGHVVITMDADMQDSPDEVPALYKMIIDEGYDLVSGWKSKRYDPLTKTIPTKLFNWSTRRISGVKNLHDFNCGLKAYKHEVIKSIEVYGEMHRYIPVIANWAGFHKIGEKIVEHRARKYGVTKFGVNRFINGFLDLMTISFVMKFGKKPMHFFGLYGTLCFLVGLAIATHLVVDKFVYDRYGMTQRPVFYFGILAMIIGTQLFLAGFIAELVSRSAPERNVYHVAKKTF